MVLRGLDTIKDMIGEVSVRAYDSLGLSNVLSPHDLPDHLLVKPVDCWAGDAEKGQYICAGSFFLAEDELYLQKHTWYPYSISQKWLNHLHGFSWLRDLRALGSGEAQMTARALVEHWIFENKDRQAQGWSPEIMAQRLSMWIAHFDFFSGQADERFYDLFFRSIAQQARTLYSNVQNVKPGIGRFHLSRALLYIGLALEGREAYIEKALSILEAEIRTQILEDGSHISRCPETLLKTLMILLDIRMAMMAGGLQQSEFLQNTIEKIGKALRFFVYGDKGLGVFNGGQFAHSEHLDSALSQAGVKGRVLNHLPSAGYERFAQGRSLLLFDGGLYPKRGYGKAMHAAPLSFEFAHGKDRIFVNCGTHPASEEWSESLRVTSAHNTLCIDNINACEIKKDGRFGRRPKAPSLKRQETKQFSLIEASHDGYLPLNGFTHERRLYLSEQGHDLKGEDRLVSVFEKPQVHDFAIRFHLHPRVLVSLIREGEEALLRLPSGIGWRFFHEGSARIELEDSIYLGSGSVPRKTKQLVLYGQTAQQRTELKWALQREGL